MKQSIKPAFVSFISIPLLLIAIVSCDAQTTSGDKKKESASTDGIQWMSFEEAVAKSQKSPKKLFIDVYTNWCGWCKKMDASTFMEPEVVKFVNENYYAVKLNAETKDTIRFQEKEFRYVPEYKSNEIAISLLSGKMGYPSYVFLDESFSLMSGPVQGYLEKTDMMAYLTYFGSGLQNQQEFETYRQEFLKKTTGK